MEFEEISVGKPEPIVWELTVSDNEGELVGRPVSRGIVEGLARVAMTIDEAAALQPGEILIAPITDVGWTPYFSLIAGLATDVGSAVSHGAVIAREYGLPAIVNLKVATKVFKTGDRVRLDADKGVLVRIDVAS
jgi:phosphohistidine swiveling domain-containing protein